MTELNPDLRCCPFCGEEIKRIAVKCKHCHSEVAQLEHTESIETAVPQESNSHPTLAELDSIQCKFCAEQIKANARICRFCNRDQTEDLPDKVGKDNASAEQLKRAISNKNFTVAVGLLPQSQQSAYQSEVDRRKKSTGIAYLLYFLLGLVGGHKFYIGEIGWGMIYLFTLGGFVVGMVCDIILLPNQVSAANDRIRQQILESIRRRMSPGAAAHIGDDQLSDLEVLVKMLKKLPKNAWLGIIFAISVASGASAVAIYQFCIKMPPPVTNTSDSTEQPNQAFRLPSEKKQQTKEANSFDSSGIGKKVFDLTSDELQDRCNNIVRVKKFSPPADYNLVKISDYRTDFGTRLFGFKNKFASIEGESVDGSSKVRFVLCSTPANTEVEIHEALTSFAMVIDSLNPGISRSLRNEILKRVGFEENASIAKMHGDYVLNGIRYRTMDSIESGITLQISVEGDADLLPIGPQASTEISGNRAK